MLLLWRLVRCEVQGILLFVLMPVLVVLQQLMGGGWRTACEYFETGANGADPLYLVAADTSAGRQGQVQTSPDVAALAQPKMIRQKSVRYWRNRSCRSEVCQACFSLLGARKRRQEALSYYDFSSASSLKQLKPKKRTSYFLLKIHLRSAIITADTDTASCSWAAGGGGG